MTVSTEVDHNDYTGNGVTTSFPYTFRIFKKSDLTVQVADLNENITVLTLDTDYSVTWAGTYSGGNVVLMSPLANGWQISISRDLPVTQETDLRNQGKFFAEVHEDAFDKLTMLIQQCFSFLRLALRKPSFIANYYDALNNRIRNLRDPSQAQDAATKNYVDNGDAGSVTYADNLFKRTLRSPESSIGMLPNIAGRKNKLIAFNSDGNPIAVLPESGSATDVMIEIGAADGQKYIGRCADVSALRAIEPTQSIQLIRTVSYSTGLAPDMPRGGSDYEYDPDDTTTADDGILTIVTSDGARWKKILNDLSLTCADAGVFPSGDDDTDALNALFTVVASFWWTRGRFRLDMMGLKFRSSKGNTVEFDPNRIELVDFTIENTLYETTTAFAIVRCRPTIPFQSGVEFVKGNVERLRIKDATRRTNSPVTALHLTSDVNGAFSSVIFNELNISSPKYGIAFGNHCYLVTFNGGSCTADKDLVTSIKAGLESSLTDMGENYLFNGYGFHGGKALEWSDVGAEFNFVSCKFDFVMLGSNTASGTVVNVDGGHVEFNNSYARWFETTKPAHVRFYPAWLVCDGTNATTDHLFYDDTGTSMLNVDSNVAYWSGTAVKSMINTRLLSDKSNSLQGLQPAVRGDLNKYLVDGTFTRSTLVDRWYADMNASRTDRLTSDTTTLTRGTTTDAAGNTVGCLSIVKKSTVGQGFPSGAQLVVKVPRGTTPAHIKFKYKATTEGVPVVITARLVTVLTFDSNGIPVFGDRVITSAATTVTAGTTAAEYRSSTGLNVVQDYMTYDYVQLSISLFNVLTGGAEVKIYDVLINKIG
ncbi:hypothetical protein [Klebsiella pneumoniae]|uniref:hypothetical protein n=2 Tax=Klebsiella pneumoniae TaxID=573 RepID=UPI00065839FF|nr:hypothetical protein [Klebsiella pneumoniae]KMI19051.1 hypothetical protein SM86_03088 [Klebsiella pneumoniae]